MATNDNECPTCGGMPDAHGQAALLLVESLIHGLRESSLLTAGEAGEIAERAVSVQRDQAEAADGAATPMWRCHALLSAIATSLRTEDRCGPSSPRAVS